MNTNSKATSTSTPVPNPDPAYFVDLDEDHPDVIVVMECGCTRLKIVTVDPGIVPGLDPVVIGNGDNFAVLHNRDFVEATLDVIQDALQGTDAEGQHVMRLVGAFASRSVLAYHRAQESKDSSQS